MTNFTAADSPMIQKDDSDEAPHSIAMVLLTALLSCAVFISIAVTIAILYIIHNRKKAQIRNRYMLQRVEARNADSRDSSQSPDNQRLSRLLQDEQTFARLSELLVGSNANTDAFESAETGTRVGIEALIVESLSPAEHERFNQLLEVSRMTWLRRQRHRLVRNFWIRYRQQLRNQEQGHSFPEALSASPDNCRELPSVVDAYLVVPHGLTNQQNSNSEVSEEEMDTCRGYLTSPCVDVAQMGDQQVVFNITVPTGSGEPCYSCEVHDPLPPHFSSRIQAVQRAPDNECEKEQVVFIGEHGLFQRVSTVQSDANDADKQISVLRRVPSSMVYGAGGVYVPTYLLGKQVSSAAHKEPMKHATRDDVFMCSGQGVVFDCSSSKKQALQSQKQDTLLSNLVLAGTDTPDTRCERAQNYSEYIPQTRRYTNPLCFSSTGVFAQRYQNVSGNSSVSDAACAREELVNEEEQCPTRGTVFGNEQETVLPIAAEMNDKNIINSTSEANPSTAMGDNMSGKVATMTITISSGGILATTSPAATEDGGKTTSEPPADAGEEHGEIELRSIGRQTTQPHLSDSSTSVGSVIIIN